MTTLTAPSQPEHEASAGPSELETEATPRGMLGFLADLLGRIVRGIKGMAPMVLAAGCQTTASPPSPRPEPAVESAPSVSVGEEPAEPPDAGPRQIGKFNITFYYVVGEDEIIARANRKKPPANDNGSRPGAGQGAGSQGAGSQAAGGEGAGSQAGTAEVAGSQAGSAGGAGSQAGTADRGKELAAATPPEMVKIYGPSADCVPIAETTREFAYELRMQGTGKLRDGRIVGFWGPCNCPNSPCFRIVEQQHWGTTGTGRPLQPFRTVAVDPKLIKLGSLLHIPLLEGRTMPGRAPWGGFVHDGCVIADDTGGAIRDYRLDLFVGRRGWFLGRSGSPGRHSWARSVPVYDGSKICERKGRQVSRKTGAI
jgi:3D (Asp-Asp-Asp) domain-containing protein